ncbi:phosphate/phosphite/phosphonate ABC transporter substrate-binding protein [Pseudonocardia nigra]|uniref:phosphate/phosphite/phosphonate ABC transporter substrate-binding protein n=1 Tax=Pseudonocardia nigra TaxID=1921578 RepID=UPI001C5D467C|nr:phosphate/phosphite/phosphonate ABC transporter substrate-binding protein [Pseudonocardia nigra]
MPRTTVRLRVFAAGCLVALAGLTACASDDPATAPLRLGLPPGEASPEFQERFAPVEQLIEEATGREVEVTTTSDYLAIVEAMRSDLIDLAVFSPFPTPIAEQVADVEPLVAGNTEVYNSVIVCRTDSGITDVQDIGGRTVAFVDAGSTSGNYIPKLLLKRAGIDPDTGVEGTYAGGHDVALLAAAQGSADCAATAGMQFEQAVAEGAVEPDVVQVVAESEPIPISLIVIARDGLDPAVKQSVTDAFLDAPQAVLDAGSVTGFQTAEPEDFDLFREAARELGVDLEDVE